MNNFRLSRLISLLLALNLGIYAQSQANIDLGIAKLLRQNHASRTSNEALADSINIIADIDAACIDGLPARIRAQAGGIAVMRVAVADLEALRQWPGIKAMRSSHPLTLHLDQARAMGNVDPVHAGIDLPQGFDGSGVTVGMVDVGFDLSHPAFSTADGSGTRLRYFADINEDTIIQASCPEEFALVLTDDSAQFHATHTTSIAAGGYAGGEYYGVAPNADIVAAGIDLTLSEEACILIGSQLVANKIHELGQPGVMNMSIGSLGSPHDPSNLSARFLDAIAAEIPFCLSAGNDGHNNVCVRLDFTEEEPEQWVLAYAANLQYLTMWSRDNTQFTTTAYLYPKDKVDDLFGPLAVIDHDLDEEVIVLDTDPAGDTYSDILAQYVQSGLMLATSAVYEDNNRYYNEWYLEFEKIPEDESKRIFLAFKIEAEPGVHVDCYAEAQSNIFYRPKSGNILRPWVEPTADGTISTLTLGENILSIGACDSQNGDVTYFSSWGTYQMPGRNLPLVLAPGASVVAALSHYPIEMGDFSYDYFAVDGYGQECYYGPQGGTSMSSPFVAGTIALWLQANPELTVKEIQEVIAATSVKNDYYYADSTPERWGAGIIDAYAGMKYVLANMGISAVAADGGVAPMVKLVNGVIEISTAGSTPFLATLYDMSGRKLRASQGPISAAELPSGVYVVTVCINNGIYSYKILI